FVNKICKIHNSNSLYNVQYYFNLNMLVKNSIFNYSLLRYCRSGNKYRDIDTICMYVLEYMSGKITDLNTYFYNHMLMVRGIFGKVATNIEKMKTNPYKVLSRYK